MVKLELDTVPIGQVLPWSLYDRNGFLLLKSGSQLNSSSQLHNLSERGLFRDYLPEELTPPADLQQLPKLTNGVYANDNPLLVINQFAADLQIIFAQVLRHDLHTLEKAVLNIAQGIIDICNKDCDTALAALSLHRIENYTTFHSVDTAVLSDVLARALNIDQHERLSITAAALTFNLGMADIQESLNQQTAPLSPEQQLSILSHPLKSHEILKKSGITDKLWLTAVLQHHENDMGEGYPQGLGDTEIVRAAKIIAIADSYSAMISRSYKKKRSPQEALKEVLDHFGENDLSLTLIKELGAYPPGSIVRLKNGDIGVVIKRLPDRHHPIVVSILGPRGTLYQHIVKRETKLPLFNIVAPVTLELPAEINFSRILSYH